MSDETAIMTTAMMMKNYRFYRQLYGDCWDEQADPYKRIITAVMDDTGDDLMAVATILSKRLNDAGRDPTFLLAVAVDMVQDDNTCGRVGAQRQEAAT